MPNWTLVQGAQFRLVPRKWAFGAHFAGSQRHCGNRRGQPAWRRVGDGIALLTRYFSGVSIAATGPIGRASKDEPQKLTLCLLG